VRLGGEKEGGEGRGRGRGEDWYDIKKERGGLERGGMWRQKTEGGTRGERNVNSGETKGKVRRGGGELEGGDGERKREGEREEEERGTTEKNVREEKR